MKPSIALLRGVNVGGRNLISMSELRAHFAALGLSGARTLLQSGNVVFEASERTAAELELFLEAETEKRLKLRVSSLVRSADEWKELAARNPFRAEAKSDPGRLLVLFMKKAPAAKDVAALQAAVRGPEQVRVRGRQAYIHYPDGMGRSKLATALIEKKLGASGTGRNWNTVLKLAALAGV